MHKPPMTLATLCLLLTACGSSNVPGNQAPAGPAPATGKYDVTVTRTGLGIPHLKANDFGSIGYGYGYAHAEDNLCVVMEDIVTINGNRAKHMGRDGSYTIVPNGVTADNVTSDFYWKFAATDEAIAPITANTDPDFQKVTEGFVDGFSRYVREIQQGGHVGRHAACRDSTWLREITPKDMYKRYFRLALIASGSVFINEIAGAAPPIGGGSNGEAAPEASPGQKAAALRADPGPLAAFSPDNKDRFGSNMYALGKDATEDGRSIVFGNPHFPWTGTERLYLAHMTIPDKLNIMGVGLYGVPAALIGFNEHFAWSHTVSTAYRFTFYELTLAPGDPTSYVYDGQIIPMESETVNVEILEDDGSTSTETRTLYRSKFGPMLVLNASGVDVLRWGTDKAYTLRDANAENDRLINQFARWNTAQSLDEFIELHASTLGIPWVNTVATGPNGRAYYGDVSVVPHVTDAKVQTCGAEPINTAVQQLVPGLPTLDGSRAACEWGTDEDAPAPGIFGAANLPTLQRDDWVHNCNDSYWLTNPAEPITGFARIIGSENEARSLRTRLCIKQIQRRLDGSDGLAGDKYNIQTLQQRVLDSHVYSTEIGLDALLANVCPLGTVLTDGGPVDISEACTVLANWDRSNNVDSVGGHIWREFFRDARSAQLFFTTPYSNADPVNTPADINVASPEVQNAFGTAVAAIQNLGIALDAPMGSLQHPRFIDPDNISIFGGEGFTGSFTIASSGRLNGDGYGVTYGNSYIQTVTWDAVGNGFEPDAQAFVTYSQSTDPANPHYADYTREYAAKRWKQLPWTEAEIEADRISRQRLQE